MDNFGGFNARNFLYPKSISTRFRKTNPLFPVTSNERDWSKKTSSSRSPFPNFFSHSQNLTLIPQMKGNNHHFSQSPFFLLMSLTLWVHRIGVPLSHQHVERASTRASVPLPPLRAVKCVGRLRHRHIGQASTRARTTPSTQALGPPHCHLMQAPKEMGGRGKREEEEKGRELPWHVGLMYI